MMTSDVLTIVTWIIIVLCSNVCGDNSSYVTTQSSSSLSSNFTSATLSSENRAASSQPGGQMTDGRSVCSPSPCHPEAVCVSLGEMMIPLSSVMTLSLLMTGQVRFKCLCPPGSRQALGDAKDLIRKQTGNLKTGMCQKNSPPPPEKLKRQRVYRGTLTGGLLLDGYQKKIDGAKKPFISIVDDITDDIYVNMKKMREEHEQKPEHFGIHLSKLKALENDTLKQNQTEIISDIF